MGADKKKCVDIATATYKDALLLAAVHLSPTDPVFLGETFDASELRLKLSKTQIYFSFD